jgi:hypothetical protein
MGTWAITWRVALEAGAAGLGWTFGRGLYPALKECYKVCRYGR